MAAPLPQIERQPKRRREPNSPVKPTTSLDPSGIRPRPLTSTFTRTNGFKEYNQIFKLKKELDCHLPTDVTIKTAFINSNDELVIKVATQKDYQNLRANSTWTTTAFGTGINPNNKVSKFFLALLNIDTSFNVEDDETITEMKTSHQVTAMKRIMNRKLNTATRTVQLCLADYEAYEQLATSGKIKLG